MNLTVWSRKKHEAMLKRLGLEKHTMTKDEALTLLKRARTLSEMKDKIIQMALSSSLSRYFVQCQRSDLLRAGVYLMWHKGFRLDDEKVSFHRIVNMKKELEE